MSARRTLVLLGLAVVASACSGGSGGDGSSLSEGTRATGGGVQVLVPDGWVSEETPEGAMVVANTREDIYSEIPKNPRVVAELVPSEDPDPAELLNHETVREAAVQGTPEEVTVDGQPGVAVETSVQLTGERVVSRVISVDVGGGRAYTILAEAPESEWDSIKGLLQQIVGSIHFTG